MILTTYLSLKIVGGGHHVRVDLPYQKKTYGKSEKKMDMKRVNIRISPEVHEWFKMRSEKTGVPMSSLMFLALEQYIQQQTIAPYIPDMIKELKGE